MLSRLEPKGISICGSAEALPLRSAWFDVVAAATSFHWFDPAVAVPEMRRVLRPAGTVALLNNIRDERVAWVSALSRLIGSERDMVIIPGGADRMAEAFAARLTGHGLFKNPEHRIFHHRQQLTEERLAALVQSRSYVAIMGSGRTTVINWMRCGNSCAPTLTSRGGVRSSCPT